MELRTLRAFALVCLAVLCVAATPGTAPAPAPAPTTPPPQSPAPAPEIVQERPGPFDQGRISVGLTAGSGGNSSNRYFVIGAGVGYFIIDGLQFELDLEAWVGGDPNITKLSPGVRYIVHQIPVVHPYAGGFYRHWFVADNLPDVDTVGGRGGLIIVTNVNLYAGGGVVYEAIVSDCESDCSEVYPEFFISLSF